MKLQSIYSYKVLIKVKGIVQQEKYVQVNTREDQGSWEQSHPCFSSADCDSFMDCKPKIYIQDT